MQAHEIFHLLMVAFLLGQVLPRSLSASARRAVRGAAVPQTAAVERAGQVRAHGSASLVRSAIAPA